MAVSDKPIIHNKDKLKTANIVDLKDTQGNLKDLTEKNYNKLKNSILKKGFIVPFFVWEGDELYILDGHQRKRVIENEGWLDKYPYVSIPADSLEEAAENLLLIASQFGTITQEGVDEYFATYKLDDVLLGEIHFDNIFNQENEEDIEDSPYTGKIETPVYEPSEEKPQLDDLVDKTKANELIAEIQNSKLPEEIKDFLIVGAQRHNVFNYAKIADFYAHADKELQELMEASALVIIDFEKAIENGFVNLTEELAKQYKKDNNA